jgi:DNA-binding beta-propeller fold protein YncE
VTGSSISRRAVLLAPAALLGCGRRKATGFPGYCFVASRAGRSVAAVDLNGFRLRKAIALGAGPAAIVAYQDPYKPRVYALAPENGTIYEIDVASLAVSRKAQVSGQAAAVRLSPGSDALWTLCRDPAALVELPLKSFRPARRIPLPAGAESSDPSFDLSEDGRAAIGGRKSGGITIVSLARGAIERTIADQAEATLLQFRKDGQLLIAGNAADRSLTLYEAATGRTVVRLPLAIGPRHFCISPDGGQLFVSGDGMDAVVIAFPYRTEVDQTVLAGHAPGAMAVTGTSPAYLLVANPDTSSVTALDMDTHRLVAAIQVGRGPGEIVLTPDNQYALAIDETSGDVAVIRLSTLAEPWVRRYKSAPVFNMIPVGNRPAGAVVVGFRG